MLRCLPETEIQRIRKWEIGYPRHPPPLPIWAGVHSKMFRTWRFSRGEILKYTRVSVQESLRLSVCLWLEQWIKGIRGSPHDQRICLVLVIDKSGILTRPDTCHLTWSCVPKAKFNTSKELCSFFMAAPRKRSISRKGIWFTVSSVATIFPLTQACGAG